MTVPVRLSPRDDVGDDLTELLEALTEYSRGRADAPYVALQRLAEDIDGALEVDATALGEFTSYMREFGIEVQVPKRSSA